MIVFGCNFKIRLIFRNLREIERSVKNRLKSFNINKAGVSEFNRSISSNACYLCSHLQNPNYKCFCLNLFLYFCELRILSDLPRLYLYKLLDIELLKKELIPH